MSPSGSTVLTTNWLYLQLVAHAKLSMWSCQFANDERWSQVYFAILFNCRWRWGRRNCRWRRWRALFKCFA